MKRKLVHTPGTIILPRLAHINIEPDGLYCRADKALIPYVAEALQYDKDVARPGQWGTKVKRQPAYFIDRRNGLFLYGLLERVASHLTAKGVQFNVEGHGNVDLPPGPVQAPALTGITLRPDQEELVYRVRDFMRGVIVSPTGSGKTITALGVVSLWPNARSLILVHRLDILKQFEQRAALYLPHIDVQVISGGQRPALQGQLICSTVQTFSKYPIKETLDRFDVTICDECHHVSDRKGQFGLFMQRNLAPVKVGFTATVPVLRDKLLAMEGILGPVIGELTVQEGQEMGIIAKPYVTLVPVPYQAHIGDYRKYRDLYEHGIVNNRARNVRITKLVLERASRGLTSLSIVKEVQHGHNLVDYAHQLGLSSVFIHGGTVGQDRDAVKAALTSKQVWNVICTDVWREGVDIPTLDCIIMAGAGKSELQTVQGVGRGMRTAPGKERVEIIDFLDPYRYLARHAIKRITVYAEKGWL